MPNFGEQPTSTNRDRISKNEESAENTKKQLAEALAAEDYAKVAELGGQMKSLQGQKEGFINKDEEEGHLENAERDFDKAKTEDAERTAAKEAEKAEAERAAKELEEMKLKDETESAAKAEEILKKINGETFVEEKPAETKSENIEKTENLALQDGDAFRSFEESMKDGDGKYSEINNSRQQRLFKYMTQKYPEFSKGSEDFSKWNENYKTKYNEIVNTTRYQEEVINHPHVLKNYPGLSFEDFVKNKKQILDEIDFRDSVEEIKKKDFSKHEMSESDRKTYIERMKKDGIDGGRGIETALNLYKTGEINASFILEAINKDTYGNVSADQLVEKFPASALKKLQEEDTRFQEIFQKSLERSLKGKVAIGADAKLLPDAYRAFIKKIPIDQYHIAKAEQYTGINIKKALAEFEEKGNQRKKKFSENGDYIMAHFDTLHHSANLIETGVKSKKEVMDNLHDIVSYASKTKNINFMNDIAKIVSDLKEKSIITSEDADIFLQSM